MTANGKHPWVVVSFYTVGTGYEQEVKKLQASLEKFDLQYHLFPCEAMGSWRKNLSHKSRIIREAFDMFPDQDIVFIDADGIVRQYPALFDELSRTRKATVAAHFHPYKSSVRGGSLLSGTLWFANDENGRRLVDRWHKIGVENEDVRHQHCLNLAIHALSREGQGVVVYRLPREYTLIFDYYRGKNKPKPVIEHFQASRHLKRQVGMTALLPSSFTRLEDKNRHVRLGPRGVPLRKQARGRHFLITTDDINVVRK